MLRNQVIDPESPERKGTNPNLGVKVSPQTEYEDPWYAASNDNSPRNENHVTGSFGNSSLYMDGSMGAYGNDAYNSMSGYDDYENEPPLLEELGVNFDHVLRYEASFTAFLYISCICVLFISSLIISYCILYSVIVKLKQW